MRIATWNINGLNARLDFVKIWLRARKPDIVGLQELKMADEKIPVEAFEELGYHVATHGQKAWNGVAILSREPIEVLQRGLPGEDEFGSRLITGRTSGMVFTTVYCPNGKTVSHDDFPKKLAWFDSLREHLPEHHRPDQPAVVCGDFNLCPAAIDSHAPERLEGHIFHTHEERARFAAMLEMGWDDLYRSQHPFNQNFSWWDYRAGAFHKGHGLRIDFVLGTKAVRDRMVGASIDRDYRKKHDGLTPSDHAPVWVDLD